MKVSGGLQSSKRPVVCLALLGRMRHDGCGGLAAKAELLTGIEGAAAGQCGGSCCARDAAPRRIYGGDLPTARTTLRNGYVRVLVFCLSCRYRAPRTCGRSSTLVVATCR